ncbi:hypothetical protein COX21_01620 [Candidatus Falkowbacteria bacterium CG23_combo_of_CG06-09_8_20_14_all_41_10]|uniref:Uncharacterized protein n=1 Tax=Candidatus Falkowbacteria bacterium CG23_combo_of_CG06-09_8_20_14_all_41_10 TaxID=1974571 RepID=A0A2G9ZNE6_9BACT|nr:MAG: hypothetical protein COX21_01620 [Candidatus Falkowbacteria bacterium CG23_combo_of_CG06-09_8_20_14_all_41_10]
MEKHQILKIKNQFDHPLSRKKCKNINEVESVTICHRLKKAIHQDGFLVFKKVLFKRQPSVRFCGRLKINRPTKSNSFSKTIL